MRVPFDQLFTWAPEIVFSPLSTWVPEFVFVLGESLVGADLLEDLAYRLLGPDAEDVQLVAGKTDLRASLVHFYAFVKS